MIYLFFIFVRGWVISFKFGYSFFYYGILGISIGGDVIKLSFLEVVKLGR